MICSIALRNVLPSTTFGWSGAVGVPFHPRLPVSGFDIHGSSTLQLSFTLMWLLLGRPVNALSLFKSQSTVFLSLCCRCCRRLHQGSHSTCCGWCFQTFFPPRAPTALVVGSVSSHSSLLQGFHSACCGWRLQPFFPASGLPQHLLWIVFPAILPCFRASTALVVDSVSSRSCLLQGSHSAYCGYCSQMTSFAQL